MGIPQQCNTKSRGTKAAILLLYSLSCAFGSWASPVVQMVKNPPGFDPWVGKIPCRRAWQPISVFLSGKSPWTEVPGRLQSMGLQRVRHDWVTKHSTHHMHLVPKSDGAVGKKEQQPFRYPEDIAVRNRSRKQKK